MFYYIYNCLEKLFSPVVVVVVVVAATMLLLLYLLCLDQCGLYMHVPI